MFKKPNLLSFANRAAKIINMYGYISCIVCSTEILIIHKKIIYAN